MSIGDSVTWLDDNPCGSGSSGDGMFYGYQKNVQKKIKFKKSIQFGQNGGTLAAINGIAHTFWL